MATYYIRKTGSDAAAGTSAGAAWLTIGKALGAAGIASGDTVYIGAGVYREVVTVAMTSAVAETKIIADVDGSKTGDSGEVQWTAYLTNDITAPSATTLLNLSARDFLTFQDISFIGGGGVIVTATTATSTNITFYRCLFVATAGIQIMSIATAAANVAFNWVVDSCILVKMNSTGILMALTRPATADFDVNFIVKNCLFVGANGNSLSNTVVGANTFNPGGVVMRNCTQIGAGALMTTAANTSTSIPFLVYNCFIYSGSTALIANATGQIIEDYNVIVALPTPRTNVTAGTHSIADGSYAPLFFTGHEYYSVGAILRPFGMPKVGSPLLGFGNQAGSPTTDILGAAKSNGVGCYELNQSAVRETTTVRTGANSISITGIGYFDFVMPVNSGVSTTIGVYTQFDGTYAGTKPSMNIVNGTECGVANATATAVGSSGSWELLTLNFTPTSNGLITVRLISSSTASTGKSFFDDFSITT